MASPHEHDNNVISEVHSSPRPKSEGWYMGPTNRDTWNGDGNRDTIRDSSPYGGVNLTQYTTSGSYPEPYKPPPKNPSFFKRWRKWIFLALIVLIALAIGLPLGLKSRSPKRPKPLPIKETSTPRPSDPLHLTPALNSPLTFLPSSTQKLVYLSESGNLSLADFTSHADETVLTSVYPLSVITPPKPDSPLAAVSWPSGQSAIFYIAQNNTVQSREGILALEILRFSSLLSQMALVAHRGSRLAAAAAGYTEAAGAALFFQLRNGSLVSYTVESNVWRLDRILWELEPDAGAALAAAVYGRGDQQVLRLFYEGADNVIRDYCRSEMMNGWAECANRAPVMEAFSGGTALAAAATKNGGLRVFYQSSERDGAALMSASYDGKEWTDPEVVDGVHLDSESNLAVNPKWGQDGDKLALYFSRGTSIKQCVWSNETITVVEL